MELRLPDLGEGVMEGEVARWLVKPGDDVKEEKIVVEVMTDKATMEIPTKVAGKVGELLVKEGNTVKVGQALMSFAGSSFLSAPPKIKTVFLSLPKASRPTIVASGVVAFVSL